jgi:hypothetical protein
MVTDRGKLNFSERHFVHHKFYSKCHGIESGFQVSEVDDLPPEGKDISGIVQREGVWSLF